MSAPIRIEPSLAERIANRFGLDPNAITGITINLSADSAPTMTFTYCLWDDERVIDALSTYRIVPIMAPEARHNDESAPNGDVNTETPPPDPTNRRMTP